MTPVLSVCNLAVAGLGDVEGREPRTGQPLLEGIGCQWWATKFSAEENRQVVTCVHLSNVDWSETLV